MRPLPRRNAAVLAACLLSLAGTLSAHAADDAEAVLRELFSRYAAGDVRGVTGLWSHGAAADAFLRRHRPRLERRCMRLESLELQRVSDDPPVFEAASTILLRSEAASAEWWESARTRIAMRQEGSEWRITGWEPRELELIDRLLAATPGERASILASSPSLQTTTFVRLASQRSVDLSNRGDLAAATALAGQAVEVAERLGEPAALSTALSSSSIVERTSARLDTALARAEEALALAERAGDPDSLARALVRLTRTHDHLSGAPAPELVARALALSDSIEETAISAHAAVHLARAYELRGDLRQAFRYAGLGWRLAEESGDNAARTSAAILLHGMYVAIGDFPLAARYEDSVIALSRDSGFDTLSDGAVKAAINLLWQGNLAEALRVVNAGFALARTPVTIADLHRARARVYWSLDRFDDAQRELEQAVALNPLDAAARAEASLDMSTLELLRGNYERAIEHARAGSGANQHYDRAARHQHAEVLARLGQLDEARTLLEGVLSEYDVLTVVEPWQGMFHGMWGPSQRLLIDILTTQGDVDAALRLTEEVKSRGLVDALRHGQQMRASAQEKHPRELVIEGRIRELNRRLASGALSGAEAAAAREQLSTARIDLLDLRQRLYAGGTAAPIERSAAPCLDDLPPHLDDVTIVHYVVGEERTIVFVIGPKRRGRREVTVRFLDIRASRLYARTWELATLTEQRSLRVAEVAARMYDLLVAPIEPALRDAHLLCIIPDFALWRVPFQILGLKGGPLLIERMPVFYAPSIAVLTATHRQEERPRNSKPRLLAFANPVVGAETASLYRAFDANAPLGQIPETAVEVREIARIYGKDASRVYVGPLARETTLKKEAPRYDVLHIATHGMVYDTKPMFSSLLLNAAPGDENDGVLEAREIATMTLHADLAMLSACQTGRANDAGSGVIGLSWAFLAAGCSTTVVSQWSTQSAAAAKLAVEFHRQLARGQSKPEALRRAQLALRQDRRYRHPFYWAPFVVVGNP